MCAAKYKTAQGVTDDDNKTITTVHQMLTCQRFVNLVQYSLTFMMQRNIIMMEATCKQRLYN